MKQQSVVCVWVMLWTHLVSQTSPVDLPGHHSEMTITRCLDSGDRDVTCKCGEREMVYLKSVVFGYASSTVPTASPNTTSTTKGCYPHHTDCTAPDSALHHCNGLQQCAINLPTGTTGRHLVPCDRYANYISVTYQCVAWHDVIDICATPHVVTSQTGYITTPNYPYDYPADELYCTLNITVHPSQRIHVYTIDFNLGTECADMLSITHFHRSATLCSKRRVDLIDQTAPGSILMTFTSQQGSHDKGFWLYYEAVPHIEYTTTSEPTHTHTTAGEHIHALTTVTAAGDNSDMTTRITEHTRGDDGDDGNSDIITSDKQKKKSNKDMYVIAGCVAAVLVTILVVLLIILYKVIKRQRKSRLASSHSATQLTPKIQCSVISGSYGPYIQNHLANAS